MRALAVLLIGLGLAYSVRAQSGAGNPSVPCLASLKNDPKVQLLAGKLPFDVVTAPQSLAVLANQSKPDAIEKDALSHFVAESERCLDLADQWRKLNYPPEVNALLTTYRVDLIAALADLYAGKSTYGDVAKFRAKQVAEMRNNMEAIDRQVQGERAKSDQSSQDKEDARLRALRDSYERQVQADRQREEAQLEARRQAALQLLLNRPAYQPFQLPSPTPLRRPQTQTNCSMIGNQWTCTTY